MLPTPVEVRDATPDDAPALLDTWQESLGDPTKALDAPPDSAVAAAVARILADPAERLLVGVSGSEIAGMAYVRRAPLTPIHDEDAVHIHHLHVRRDFRHRGVGKALLGEAALWADEKDTRNVVATAAATARDCHRFLARLGLTQVAVVRATTVANLRIKLAAAQTASAAAPVVAARRSLLRRRAIREGTD